jgi:hypothetical protein
MNGTGKLIVLITLVAFEGRGYSQVKRPGGQEKSIEAPGRSRKVAPKELDTEAAAPSYFAGAFAAFDLYGIVLGYREQAGSEIQIEARSVRGDSDTMKDVKWKRHEDSLGIHKRYYKKDDSWCLSVGFIGRDATFRTHGGSDAIYPDSELLVRRQDLAFRIALGTQYQAGSFVWGFDWLALEHRLLTMSSTQRVRIPAGSAIPESLKWERRYSDELFERLAVTSVRIGWRF